MLNHTFTFNGHTSDEFGIKIEQFRALNRSARKYDAASVPGRSGNIYSLQKAWEENLVSYQIFAKGSPINILDMTQSSSPVTGTDQGYIINGTASGTMQMSLYDEVETKGLGCYQINGIGTISGVSMKYIILTDQGGSYANGTVPADGLAVDVPHGYELIVNLQVSAGTYNNVLVPCYMYNRYETMDLDARWTGIMEWLNSADGYAELSDTYDTKHYHEAVFVDATDIENSWNEHGRAVVSFRCRPERFLSSGQSIQLDLSDTITIGFVNSTSLNLRESPSTSDPIIKVLAAGEQFKILASQTVSGVLWYQVLTEDNIQGWCQGEYVTVEQAIVLNNPTNHTAKPYITLSPVNGEIKSIKINHTRLIMSNSMIYTAVYVDCEHENITGLDNNGVLREFNSSASIVDNTGNITPAFLGFKAGENLIVVDTVSAVEIDANFWEI